MKKESINAFAKRTNRSIRQVERDVQNGLPVQRDAAGRVWVLVRRALAWRATNIDSADGSGEVASARAAFVRARAMREELKLAAEQRQTMRVSDGLRVLGEAYSTVRAQLIGLPRRAAPLLVNLPTATDVEAKLTPLVYEAMDAIRNAPSADDVLGPAATDGIEPDDIEDDTSLSDGGDDSDSGGPIS